MSVDTYPAHWPALARTWRPATPRRCVLCEVTATIETDRPLAEDEIRLSFLDEHGFFFDQPEGAAICYPCAEDTYGDPQYWPDGTAV